MKNIIIITMLVFGACTISSCGDRVPKSGTADTVKNTYGSTPDTSKPDTSKGTGLDNSGSGGTNTDSTKKDTAKK